MSTETRTVARPQTRIGIRTIAQIGMLAAIAVVLMLFEIPLPFAPSFYEIDFSEVPVMVGCFTMGPLAGAAIELIKILLNFVINGTKTAGVERLQTSLLDAHSVFRRDGFTKSAVREKQQSLEWVLVPYL